METTFAGFVSVRDAADVLGLPRWKIWKAVREKQIRSYRFMNGRILVRLSEIITLIESSAVRAQQEAFEGPDGRELFDDDLQA
jgi:excisionase family DNA binding protein